MRTITFLILMLLSSFAHAKAFTVNAKFSLSGYNVQEIDHEAAKRGGWEIEGSQGEYTYKLNTTVKDSQLPFKAHLGEAFLTISKTGLIEMGISIGDDDAGTVSSLQWPFFKKAPILLSQPLTMKLNGGENASDTWSFDGSVQVTYN